jgi:REP element-mobilizing transposase RayT
MDLDRGSPRVGQNLYHIEWCPKYRYKMFHKEETRKLCEGIIKRAAEGHGIEIPEAYVMLDRVLL